MVALLDLPPVQWATYWPVHDAIMAEFRRAPRRSILDVGCGTGQLSARIARELPGATVTGCDFSRGMLRQAALRDAAGRWVQGDACRLPFRDAAFDAAVSTEAFHWFPDQARAAAELYRVLAPGGVVLVALVSSPSRLFADGMYAASRLLGEPFYWPTSADMRERFEHAGFRIRAQKRIFRLPGGLLLPPMLTVALRPEATRSASTRGSSS